ncbi:MAG: kelch repeat-containing protein [Candidatus Brocadiia bacterium]
MQRRIVLSICALLFLSSLFIAAKGSCVSNRTKINTDSSRFSMLSPTSGAVNVSYKTPVFTWTDLDSEQNYILQIDNESNFDTPVYVNDGIPPDTTSFTLPIGRLLRNTTYWWRILAVDLHTSERITASNAPFSFTTADILTAPEAFDLISPNNGDIVYGLTPILSWSNPETGKTFTLQVDNNSAFTSTPLIYTTSITSSGASTTSCTIPASTLEVYKTYYWRVVAVNEMGQTPATNAPWSFYTMGPLPGEFSLITPTYNSVQYTLTPTFYWGMSSDAQYHTMEISITDTFTSPVTRTISPAVYPATCTTYTYATSPSDSFVLEVRQKYYWRVFSNNTSRPYLPSRDGVLGYIEIPGAVSSSYSAFTTFQPGEAPEPFTMITPTNTARNVIQSQVFQWSYSTGTATYTLQIDNNSNFLSPEFSDNAIPSNVIDTSTRPITPGILWAGTTYYWRVIAVNSNGQVTATGAPWSFTIRPWAEDTPTTIEQLFPGRAGHTAIWTGTEMVIWGGRGANDEYYNSGWKYNPSNNEWVDVAMTNAPVSRAYHTAVWDSARGNMLIWGGWNGTTTHGSGGILNIDLNTWVAITTTGAPLSRTDHTAIWVSSKNAMFVWGGGWQGVEYFNDGFKYTYSVDWTTNPVSITDSWSQRSPYAFDTNNTSSALSGRLKHTAIWGYDDGGADIFAPSITGTAPSSPGRNDGWEMYVWGGYNGAWFLSDGARYSDDINNWKRITTDSPCPTARYKHTAVWTGAEMVIWGGQYGGTYLNSGAKFYPGRPAYTYYGAWADIVNYSYTYDPSRGYYYTSVYSPINGWTTINTAGSPAPRSGHTAVIASTVGKMLVWGGRDASTYLNSGGMYDTFSDIWTPMSSLNAPQGREEHTAVWSGTEMLAWGGFRDTTFYSDGGRFNPTTNTWTPIASPSSLGIAARERHTAVWTGTEMIMWGGDIGFTSTLKSGARYNPTSNKWGSVSLSNSPAARTQHTSIWIPAVVTNTTVSETMISWGGYSGTAWLNTGAIYNPRTNTWSSINSSLGNTPSIRAGHIAVWDDVYEQMIIWGGADGTNYLNTGARYNPGSGGSWLSSTTTGAPSVRSQHTAVWTGTEMLIWGGFNEDSGNVVRLQTGARYNSNPAGDSWTAITTASAPVSRSGHTAVWAPGYGMMVWGGESAINVPLNTGSVYSTTANTWVTITTPATITARAFHTAVWTGTEMVVFGGWNGTVYMKDGGRYDPITDTWKSFDITTTTERAYHSAVWVGPPSNQIILWGGAILGGYTNTGVRYVPMD